MVALNRAVAVAEVAGSAAALALVDALALERYHLFHAIRADLLQGLGRRDEAAAAYEAAIALAANEVERRLPAPPAAGARLADGFGSVGPVAPADAGHLAVLVQQLDVAVPDVQDSFDAEAFSPLVANLAVARNSSSGGPSFF